MKPIFEKEKHFLEERLNLKLPSDCWRDGNSIYLNIDKDTLIIKFKVEHKQLLITKNKLEEVLNSYKNKSFIEEIKDYEFKLQALEEESLNKTIECMKKYPDYEFRVSDSTGKDSALCHYIFRKACKKLGINKYEIDFFNTSNDTADTYKQIKKNIKNTISFQYKIEHKKDISKEELETKYNDVVYKWIHNPNIGWHQWIKEVKHYYLPSIMVRNCCSTYKEGKLKEVLDKSKNYVLFLGMRKYESVKRQHYDYYLNDKMDKLYKETGLNKYKCNVPKNWIRFLPIVNWRDEEVWLFIMKNNIEINPMYYLGFNRVGCLCCPYSSDYNDLLIEHYYPYLWNNWCQIVEKNYELYNVKNRLKWSKEEYIQEGKWKSSTSKLQEYITKNPTKVRVQEVANILNISEEVAEKYFKQTCSCGKKLNPDEIAMFLKLYGRYEGKTDDRTYLCKSCLCKQMNISKEKYSEKVKEFREQGCNLF